MNKEKEQQFATLRLPLQSLPELIVALDVARIHGTRATARFSLGLIDDIEKGPTEQVQKVPEDIEDKIAEAKDLIKTTPKIKNNND